MARSFALLSSDPSLSYHSLPAPDLRVPGLCPRHGPHCAQPQNGSQPAFLRSHLYFDACYDVVVSASWIISRTLEKYQRSLRHWNSLLISCPQPPEVTTLPLLLCLVTLKKITIQFAFRKACKKTDKIRSLFSEWTIFQNKQRNTRLGRPCKLYLLNCVRFVTSCGV